jgi:hypothetical protein
MFRNPLGKLKGIMTAITLRGIACFLLLTALLPLVAGCGNKSQNASLDSVSQSGKAKRQQTGQ